MFRSLAITPTIQVIDHFLENLYLDDIMKLQDSNRDQLEKEGLIKYTSEMKSLPDDYRLIEKKLNQKIISRLVELGYKMEKYAITLSILRISSSRYQGSLHHDKNANKRRRLTVILYLNIPEEGGELVFPCFDKRGKPINNDLTNQLVKLGRKHQFYFNIQG